MSKIKTLTEGKTYRRSTVIVPPVAFPFRAASIYKRSLHHFVQIMSNSIRDSVIPELEQSKKIFITDADETKEIKSLRARIAQLIDTAANGFLNIDIFATTLSRNHANLVDQLHKSSFVSTFDRGLGVDVHGALADEGLKTVIDKHITENVKLIQSIRDDYFKRVESIMQKSLREGTSVGSIKRKLFTQGLDVDQTGALGITKRRATLIARDQTGKLNGQINAHRQQHIGITEYIWRDRNDSRVRPSHVDLNNDKFSWQGTPRPPNGEDPGQPIQCRCIAQAVVEF